MRSLAEKLREQMIRAGYPALRELAQAAHLSASTVSDALSGGRMPTWATVSALLKACGVPANTAWATLHESAKAAEKQWRQSAQPGDAVDDPHSVPGIFSIRPPIGDLPARVRGRDELFDRFDDLLTRHGSDIQVLHGLGGCGKTTVALELARRAGEAGHPVFWLSAQQQSRLIAGMRAIAQEIGVPEDQVEDAWSGRGSAPDLLWRYLDALDTRWLLVIDNADEPGLLAADDGEPGDGTGWARPSAAGLTVITTRVGSPETWGSRAEAHQIGVLKVEDAADVLIDLAGHAGDRRDAKALADRLAGLPLALVSAGTYLRRTARGGWLLRRAPESATRIATFDAYRRSLGDLGTDLLDAGLNPAVDSGGGLERLHRRLIGRTWEISLDLLDMQGIAPARGLMRLMSCFTSAPLPVDLIEVDALRDSGVLATSATPDAVDTALEALVDLHLLDVTTSGDLTAVPDEVAEPPLSCLVGHRLVLEAAAARVHALPRSESDPVWRAAAGMLEVAASAVPEEPRNWDWWQLVAPHVKAVVAAAPDDDRDTLVRILASGLRCFAYMAFSDRPLADDRAFARLLHARAVVLAEDHPVRLAIAHRHIYAGTASYAEDQIAYSALLDRQTAALGPEHPDTLITRHDLINARIQTGEAVDVEPAAREIVESRTRVLGRTDPYTLVSRMQWTRVLVDAGRVAEAEAELRAMIDDCRVDRGELDSKTLLYRAHLAELMDQRGHADEASAELRYLTEQCGVVGSTGDAHQLSPVRHRMAHMLDKEGRFAEAAIEYRAVLAEHVARGDQRSSEYRHMFVSLASNLKAQRKFDESAAHLAELIASCDDLPVTDGFLLGLRHSHGDALRDCERWAEAEAELSAVLAIRAGLTDANDSVVLTERHCHAHVLENLDRAEAEIEMREVAARYRDLLGPANATAREMSWCHAMMLVQADRFAEALPELTDCLAAELSVLDGAHRDVLYSRWWIAEVRFRLGIATVDELAAESSAILPGLIGYDGDNGRLVKQIRAFLVSCT